MGCDTEVLTIHTARLHSSHYLLFHTYLIPFNHSSRVRMIGGYYLNIQETGVLLRNLCPNPTNHLPLPIHNTSSLTTFTHYILLPSYTWYLFNIMHTHHLPIHSPILPHPYSICSLSTLHSLPIARFIHWVHIPLSTHTWPSWPPHSLPTPALHSLCLSQTYWLPTPLSLSIYNLS